jgi:hypothetical protein
MKIDNKNNAIVGEPVAFLLPFVARLPPSGYPSAARKLPACCLQVAGMLP